MKLLLGFLSKQAPPLLFLQTVFWIYRDLWSQHKWDVMGLSLFNWANAICLIL